MQVVSDYALANTEETDEEHGIVVRILKRK